MNGTRNLKKITAKANSCYSKAITALIMKFKLYDEKSDEFIVIPCLTS
ncbi:MAG: hypothetical protein ACRD8Z_23320 [Nitrososphaeraceae archaeon]